MSSIPAAVTTRDFLCGYRLRFTITSALMLSAELRIGRRIGIVLQPGDDVLQSISDACVAHDIRQGFIPVFVGAFRAARFIASHSPIDDQETPLKEVVDIAYAEGLGSGSVTWDAAAQRHQIHVHLVAGVKDAAAAGFAGHLLSATTHYVAEVVIDEVIDPQMVRVADPDAFGIENLRFIPRE
ncbi:putative DNA-binding protein with PD1-like motif [Glaciihabitans tibetensis]|uniref:Putative DNA-binding protein with PD1-like motif n=1 Tax=Glaciihabitans tibetensis TaxID=1266600 RepID=A0A2T0VF45_9MICO|nr:PPC domain-containing DNA-binding protein [Glaciihabitans tibetensis]PRY68813.1 putative DNA-binding protein with PD1-like motif [Glaciihabitans tibetensis]